MFRARFYSNRVISMENDHTEYVLEERPWGRFERFVANNECTVKLIYVDSGKRLSYQYHKKRSEFWKVVSGKLRVTLDGKELILDVGEKIEIPVGAKHRMEGITDSVVLEIAFGHFDENDIVRLDDDYKRA